MSIQPQNKSDTTPSTQRKDKADIIMPYFFFGIFVFVIGLALYFNSEFKKEIIQNTQFINVKLLKEEFKLHDRGRHYRYVTLVDSQNNELEYVCTEGKVGSYYSFPYAHTSQGTITPKSSLFTNCDFLKEEIFLPEHQKF